jgi:hypothetical protein
MKTVVAPKKIIAKSEAVECFMDLLVFTQAGFCEMKQSQLRERF